jgi:signal transduction histidine kinase
MAEPMHILIIDDSEDDLMFYRRTLRKTPGANYHITEAADGEEGLRHVQEDAPSCVLLDYSMPGRNGLEILKLIRAQHPFIPIVMMTGQGNEAVAVTAMQEGAQNYIAKASITPETLDHVIRMAVTHCALEKRIYEQRSSLEIFTHALAHDLREPVRTIRSFIELIDEREKFSGKTQEYFHYVQTAAERVDALIDMVYLYTRLHGADQLPREQCDVASILEEVQVNIKQLIEERKTVITCGPLPQVFANHTQLVQLFQNLLCNATHHCNTVPHIHVDAVESHDMWQLRVRDNGPGIAPKDREKIFEPFKRLLHPQEEGLGLGLAICKKIVELHGGKIWYESPPDLGAMFVFTLPKAVVAEKPIEQALLSKTTKPDISTDSVTEDSTEEDKLATVLLVDDSRADLELTQIRLIEHRGLKCKLLVAHNGEEALALLHQEHGAVDLMLLDINMPEMDGFELLEQMRKEKAFAHIAVLMCSGSIYDKDMARARTLGAAGYLVKPIKFDMLQTALAKIPFLALHAQDKGHALLRMH